MQRLKSHDRNKQRLLSKLQFKRLNIATMNKSTIKLKKIGMSKEQQLNQLSLQFPKKLMKWTNMHGDEIKLKIFI